MHEAGMWAETGNQSSYLETQAQWRKQTGSRQDFLIAQSSSDVFPRTRQYLLNFPQTVIPAEDQSVRMSEALRCISHSKPLHPVNPSFLGPSELNG